MRRALAIPAVLAAAALVLTGCASSDGVAGRADTGYVSGSGQVEVFDSADRQQAPSFGGELTSGEQWSSDDAAGEVMVVNFWYAACPPCRVEAPMLAEVANEFGDQVTFIGVNTRDAAPSALAFDERFGIPYESILDAESGEAQLAFSGTITPTAVPTTLVIGSDGTIAARISGALPEASILSSIVDDELG